jgi:1,4-dihydroxy-2-naphthoate octaprenyltransferase
MSASPLRRARVFFELGKFKIVELWLGFFVGVALLGRAPLHQPRALAVLALILVAGVAVIAATCSLDDIAGVRDGVDQANQGGDARWGVSKPILAGRLGERQAVGFVRLLGAVAVAATLGTIALAWPLPPWLVATMAAMMLLAVNYSYGAKLSYHGAGELVIFAGGVGTVLLPYALVAKTAPPPVIASALLVGAWHAQVVMFSNTKDAAGDRATGRMTIAARSSERGNRRYIAAAFALAWLATAVALVAGWIPGWYALPLVPVWLLQARQLWQGLGRRQWLAARLTGFRVLRVGIVALALANVLWRG